MKQHQNTPKQKNSSQKYRPDPGNLMLLLYPLGIFLFLLLVGLANAEAAERALVDRFDVDEVRQGALFFPDSSGRPQAAAQLHQDVQITVSGIVARVRLTQEFNNSSEEWLSGIYVFPLPDEAAVDRLRMTIGEREIIGEIREKEEAEAMFQKAAAQGRKSSLVAQNRPNLFTTRVANVAPGEKISITLEYQQQTLFKDGVFSLRYPLAVTPRYIPGVPQAAGEERMPRQLAFDAATGWAQDTDQVPDASQITPPQILAEYQQPSVRFAIDLAPGFALSRTESLYHDFAKTVVAEDHCQLFAEGLILSDHDVVLEWTPQGAGTCAALFAEQRGDDAYKLLMLMIPQEKPDIAQPREVVFILDVSGSMAGPSIRQAKHAVREALLKLDASDLFNIISFNSTANRLFSSARPATMDNLAVGERYLDLLVADGGTEMASALKLAFDEGREASSLLRQIVFLTDGAVGNEQELFRLIDRGLGKSRLFTVGIGAAPNSYFMSRAAVMGRGTYTYIGDIAEVRSKVSALLEKLRFPGITDLAITLPESSDVEMYPKPIPDLYYGEPLVVTIRERGGNGKLQVTGRRNGKPFSLDVASDGAASRPGIATLWARKKIRDEMEKLYLGKDEAAVKKSILATALEHQLVSQYTSLVAVDQKITRPKEAELHQDTIPTPAPRGLQLEAIFGGGSHTATPAALLMVSGTLLFFLSIIFLIANMVWLKCSSK